LSSRPFDCAHDYLQICDTLARIARAADVGDLGDYMSLLTEDVIFEFPDNRQVGLAAKTYRGADEVRAGVMSRRSAGLQGPGTHTLHLVSTVSVTQQDDENARSQAYWTYYVNVHLSPELRSMGEYDDILRRTPAGWRLAHRTISIH
jgi:3-phenylpropionate/cinnamic acid dioxygenase small subunit